MGNAVATNPKGPKVLPPRPTGDERDPSGRCFTFDELEAFNGRCGLPIYISVASDVYDVTSLADEYGPNGELCMWAGKDVSYAVATGDKKNVVRKEDLRDLEEEMMSRMAQWQEKLLEEEQVQIVGRIVMTRDMTREELQRYDGVQDPRKEILVAVAGQIYDVTLTGKEFYHPEQGMYGQFAGRDVTRALACMSLSEADLDDPRVDDLTDEQQKVLDDWVKKFKEKYVIVGRLADE